MKRRILAVILAVSVMLGLVTVSVAAEEGVTVYVTVSRYGEIVKDKDGEYVAEVPVELTGQQTYNIDDALRAVHEICYQGGAASGYNASVGEWGLSLNKLWGDSSMKFGYCVNGSMSYGLTDPVSDGDYVDACIYESYYPDTEGYAKFDKMTAQAYTGSNVTLTLYASTGYTSDWSNYVFGACEGAAITVNGEATSYVTDSSGNVTLSFDEAGTYIISASKTKVLREEDDEEVIETTVTAITAPVCVVTVTAAPTVSATAPKTQESFTSYSGAPVTAGIYGVNITGTATKLTVGYNDETRTIALGTASDTTFNIGILVPGNVLLTADSFTFTVE